MDLACYFPRTANYESINGENLKGWHQADGMTYLENANWNQYNDTFWATVNSQRLPGITVTAGANPAEGQRNGNTFAGGMDLGGLYGVVGFTPNPATGNPSSPTTRGSSSTTRWSASARASPAPTVSRSRRSST